MAMTVLAALSPVIALAVLIGAVRLTVGPLWLARMPRKTETDQEARR